LCSVASPQTRKTHGATISTNGGFVSNTLVLIDLYALPRPFDTSSSFTERVASIDIALYADHFDVAVINGASHGRYQGIDRYLRSIFSRSGSGEIAARRFDGPDAATSVARSRICE
jgi:hypothetical protein